MHERSNFPTPDKVGRRCDGRRVVSLVAAAALLAGACGDDSPSGSAATTTAAGGGSAGTEAGGAGGAAQQTFCDAVIEAESIFVAGPDTDAEGNPTPDGLAQFSEELQPLLADIETNAPEEISGEVDSVLAAVNTALEEGDPAAVETEEFLKSDTALDRYVVDNCELDGVQDVKAIDYAYEGVPAKMPSGKVGIKFDNTGKEVHEAAVVRINDGVELSATELLELPEEEAMEKTEFKGVAFAPPGDEAATVIDLEAGRYLMVCFIPVGTTSLDQLMAAHEGGGEAGAGPPHFTKGMVTEFEVS
jgi:hypothetical protein